MKPENRDLVHFQLRPTYLPIQQIGVGSSHLITDMVYYKYHKRDTPMKRLGLSIESTIDAHGAG